MDVAGRPLCLPLPRGLLYFGQAGHKPHGALPQPFGFVHGAHPSLGTFVQRLAGGCGAGPFTFAGPICPEPVGIPAG